MNHPNNKKPAFSHEKVGHCQDYKTLFRLFRDTSNWIGAITQPMGWRLIR
jgi:hypothetical protein